MVETFTSRPSDVFSFSCRLRFSVFDGGGGGEADILPEA